MARTPEIKRPTLRERPIVVSIGVTEPYAAAGMLLDFFIADRLEIRPVGVCTGVSAQDGHGLFVLQPTAEDVIQAQFRALAHVPVGAVRIGALPSVAAVDATAAFVRGLHVPVIVDPAIATSSGGTLIPEAVREAVVTRLFPYVTLVTPNRSEAETIAGHEVRTVAEMSAAALKIQALGARAVLVKGGHVEGELQDMLYDGDKLRRFTSARVPYEMRGTGCTLAATIAASMAHGNDMIASIRTARSIVRILMQSARTINGMRIVP